MSKTLLTQVVSYLDHEEIARLDAIRGYIPRSRMGAWAIRRFLEDVESGKIKIGSLPGAQLPTQRQDAIGSVVHDSDYNTLGSVIKADG